MLIDRKPEPEPWIARRSYLVVVGLLLTDELRAIEIETAPARFQALHGGSSTRSKQVKLPSTIQTSLYRFWTKKLFFP